MSEFNGKRYLKMIAMAIDLYWEGDISKAVVIAKNAENSLDAVLGKPEAERFKNSIDGCAKKWRESLLALFSASKKPSSVSVEHFQELRPPDDSFLTSESDILLPEELLPEDELHIVATLYNEDKILEAVELLQNLKEKYQMDFEEFPFVKELEADYQDIRKIYDSIQDKADWNRASLGKISVFYKSILETKSYSIKTEGTIDTPLLNCLAILFETDLYHTWVPFCKKSFTLSNLSRTRKLIFQEYDIPFLSVRHTCLYGYGANLLLTDGAIAIISKSCDQESTFKGINLPENLKSKRCFVNIMGTIIRPVNLNKIHVTLVTNFDPLLKGFTYKIFNYFSKKLAKGLFKKLAHLSKNFEGSIYQQKMNMPDNKEFYDYIQQSLIEYFESVDCKMNAE